MSHPYSYKACGGRATASKRYADGGAVESEPDLAQNARDIAATNMASAVKKPGAMPKLNFQAEGKRRNQQSVDWNRRQQVLQREGKI